MSDSTARVRERLQAMRRTVPTKSVPINATASGSEGTLDPSLVSVAPIAFRTQK